MSRPTAFVAARWRRPLAIVGVGVLLAGVLIVAGVEAAAASGDRPVAVGAEGAFPPRDSAAPRREQASPLGVRLATGDDRLAEEPRTSPDDAERAPSAHHGAVLLIGLLLLGAFLGIAGVGLLAGSAPPLVRRGPPHEGSSG